MIPRSARYFFKSRHHLIFKHAAHFRGNAGQKEKVTGFDSHEKTGRRTQGVRQRFRSSRQHGLLFIGCGHDAHSLLKKRLDGRQGRFVERSIDTGGIRGRRRGQIIAGGPQSAGDDRNVRPFTDFSQNSDQILKAISDALVPRHGNAVGFQLFGKVCRIRVNERTGSNLIPGGENFGDHGGFHLQQGLKYIFKAALYHKPFFNSISIDTGLKTLFPKRMDVEERFGLIWNFQFDSVRSCQ
jgi:hypothetical protein